MKQAQKSKQDDAAQDDAETQRMQLLEQVSAARDQVSTMTAQNERLLEQVISVYQGCIMYCPETPEVSPMLFQKWHCPFQPGIRVDKPNTYYL